MPWPDVLTNWSTLIDPLCRDFPHLQTDALRRFRGDRAKMELYLAETHDLTLSEAVETLEDWLIYTGQHAQAIANEAA